MKTKTPRTDKQVFPKGAYGQSAVSADFARQLERELAALEAENAALKSRVAELETLASFDTCPRCGVRFLTKKTVDAKSAKA